MTQAITGCVHIIDDEEDVCSTISGIIAAAGFATREYDAAEAFVRDLGNLEAGCVITDVQMPGMNGLELVRHLAANDCPHPVIVVSGQADITMAVEAMKAGAREFLEKPLDSASLLRAVRAAMPGTTLPEPPGRDDYTHTFNTLTRRQRDVLAGVLEGLPNKLIAYRLGISIRTVEHYRAAIMDKTGARNLCELVRMGIDAGL